MDEIARKRMLDAHNSLIPYGLKHQMAQEEQEKGKPKAKSVYERVRESTMSASLGMTSPRPMLTTVTPGVEVVNNDAYSAMTPPASTDGHVHMAFYDDAGNGSTDMIDGHSHVVRSFVVAPFQDANGIAAHDHPGLLPHQGYTGTTGEI